MQGELEAQSGREGVGWEVHRSAIARTCFPHGSTNQSKNSLANHTGFVVI